MKNENMLPKDVVCPYCKIELQLAEDEQKSRKFTCPSCSKEVSNVPLAPSGVGGWLLLLVVGMIGLGPLNSISEMLKMLNDFAIAEIQNPGIVLVPQWASYKAIILFIFGCIVVYSIISGFLLATREEPSSVKNAIIFLWLGGPLGVFLMVIVVPAFLFGADALSGMAGTSIGSIIGQIVVATIWTAYLNMSKRVKNTYIIYFNKTPKSGQPQTPTEEIIIDSRELGGRLFNKDDNAKRMSKTFVNKELPVEQALDIEEPFKESITRFPNFRKAVKRAEKYTDIQILAIYRKKFPLFANRSDQELVYLIEKKYKKC